VVEDVAGVLLFDTTMFKGADGAWRVTDMKWTFTLGGEP
jgi:hypothetical protein